MKTTSWKLNEVDRAKLLRRFPPSWPDLIANKVTVSSSNLLSGEVGDVRKAEVVGQIDDGMGLQALVLEIDLPNDRPIWGVYHITWSIDRARGREPKDSSKILARSGWKRLERPISIGLSPASQS